MTERALTTLAGELAIEDEEPEQLGLFAEPLTAEGQALVVKLKRGVGRPPGARNKRTERTVAWLLSRHRDPREVLLEIAESNAFDLASRYGESPAFWMQEKRLCALGALPYVAARITPEVVDNRQIIHLHFGAGSNGAGAAGAGGVAVHVLDPGEFEHVEDADAERPSAPTDDNSDT